MNEVSTKRTCNLNVTFVNGLAKDWQMAVKECFRMELDIKLTERKRNKVAYQEWTQGPYYCFSEGQVFYNSIDGYKAWHQAISRIDLACQIIEATPNTPEQIFKESTGKNVFKVKEGFVRFILYTLDEKREHLKPFIGYALSQNEFVDFLRTGKIHGTDPIPCSRV